MVNVETASAYVLVAYNLSDQFRKRVSLIAGSDSAFLGVADIRNKGVVPMLRFLRRLNRNATLYIPLEDPDSESLFPLLLILVALSSVRQVVVIDSECTARDTNDMEVFSAIFRVGLGTLAGFFAAVRAWCNAAWLRRRARIESAPPSLSSKVLYINANYWFGLRIGGSVGHIAGVANALSDLGYDIDLASASAQSMLRPKIAQVLFEKLHTHGYPQETNFLRFNFTVISDLRKRAGKQYAFIYQRMSLFNFTGVVLSRIWRIPLILEYNGSEVWIARNWGRPLRFSKLGSLIEEVCLRHAHRVVVVSKALKDEVISRDVQSDSVVCYPNCVDPTQFAPESIPESLKSAVRRRHGIANDELLVAFVGTFGRWHGAPVLAAAIKQLVDRELDWLTENKIRFAMIGDGSMLPAVREFIGGEKYAKWVVFTGLVPQNETVNYLATSDILVSPHVANADGSRFFGSPTKLFEYMAMAKGIIASDLDQIGEVLSGGLRIWEDERTWPPEPTAVLVRPGDVHDLIRGIKVLVRSSGLRRRAGINARAEMLRRYTWLHHVEHILQSIGRSKAT